MSPKSRAIILASASVLALSTATFAQDNAETDNSGVVVLDAITITASGDGTGPADGYVASYNQTGTKTDTPMLETQQSTSVVTKQQIEDQGAQNLGQALSYSAGIVGQPYGADPRFDSPVVRGFEAREAQYLNGLRMVRSFGAPAIETYGLEQVEVLRGPSSSLFGANSPAGVINQVQKRAQFDDFNEVGLGYGSNDNKNLFFDVNRAPSDNLAWRLTGIGRDGSTQIDELEDSRGYLAGAVRWQADDATLIDFIASYQKDSPITPAGVSYEATLAADDEYLRDFYAGDPDFDESDRRLTNIGLEIRRELDNGWQLTQGFRYQDADWDYKGFYTSHGIPDEGPDFITRGTVYQLEESSTINLDTRLSGEVATGAFNHRLLFGLDVRQWDGEAETNFGDAPAINWRNPGQRGDVIDDYWYNAKQDVTQTQIGIYAQDEISVGNWRGSFALRHDRSKQTGTDYDNFAGSLSADRKDNATTGRVGLSYLFNNEIATYASYSTSFLPQTGQNTGVDIYGNALEPTKSEQYEIGVKYEPTSFDGFFSAAIYDLTQKKVVRNVLVDVGGPTPIKGDIQIGEVKSKGLELEATAELDQGWSLRGAYAYNDTEQVGGPDNGKRMPNAPKHNASIWLDRDFGNGLRVGGGIRYLGTRFGDFSNDYPLENVTLVDMGASYTRGNVETSLNLFNLTDEVYLANCGSFGCYYGEGRAIQAKVSYKW